MALIVGASIGAVHSAVTHSTRWGVSEAIVGILILAALTSMPNVMAAVQLVNDGRGAAVISESLNSNTLNVLVGICLPALLFGFAAPSPQIIFATIWLVGMKLFALIAASHRHGLHRISGAVLVLFYVLFAAAMLLWH